jgi:Putative porin
MSVRSHLGAAGALALLLLIPSAEAADNASEQQSMNELRNTVINLLQTMVDKGLLTREQAQQLVKSAQDKAAADAAAANGRKEELAKEEQGAVRVPYVPQIVKDQISAQVEKEIEPQVVADVVKEAKEEQWGVPASLPEWLTRVRVFGDVTLRGQSDRYANDNDAIPDFNAINAAGGLGGIANPFLNTTQDRYRMRLRARLGVEADITPNLRAFIRLASGSLTDPGSESQTLGTYADRYPVGFDQAYLQWDSNPLSKLSMFTIEAGRMANPWFSPTELIFARDLSFEGTSGTFRFGWGDGGPQRSHVYMTIGGFPILEVPLENSESKWLVGAQVGTNLRFNDGADYIRLGAAYYNFIHVNGVQNTVDSTLTNFTAPTFIRYGNDLFDIANQSTNNGTDLFALASHFRLVDLSANYEHAFGRYSLALTGEGVRNIGFNLAQVANLVASTNGVVPAVPGNENTGYVGEVSFGMPVVDQLNKWRAALGYRYVKRDAVLDAWTDADFHEGGTNTEGFYVWGSYGIAKNTWVRLRYMSGNEIDGPRYGLDILQLDINARF